MKKAVVFIDELFNEFEVIYPYYRLLEAGMNVRLVAREAGVYAGRHGLPMEASHGIAQVKADEVDALIIPGGFAPDFMRRSPAMVELVRQVFHSGRLVAAICHGAWMLASAEVVRGKNLTCFFAIKDDLIHAGANWQDAEAVVDGNLVTSRKPEDLPAFMSAVLKVLAAQ